MTPGASLRCALALAALVFASACASRAVPVAPLGGRQATPALSSVVEPPDIPAARIPAVTPARKSAVTGFLLEYLLPGAGQLYAGNEWKAVNVLGIIGSAVLLASHEGNASVTAPVAALAIGVRFWSLWDVPASINKANRRAAIPGGT